MWGGPFWAAAGLLPGAPSQKSAQHKSLLECGASAFQNHMGMGSSIGRSNIEAHNGRSAAMPGEASVLTGQFEHPGENSPNGQT